ncbi:hypothetical protein, partial [Methylobrevis pamukkalensis]|uniref:hypothetical protein n=1 Tax=Methylobrevis pamukkalensis TaxID=1439726 RepID=UPI001AECC206
AAARGGAARRHGCRRAPRRRRHRLDPAAGQLDGPAFGWCEDGLAWRIAVYPRTMAAITAAVRHLFPPGPVIVADNYVHAPVLGVLAPEAAA